MSSFDMFNLKFDVFNLKKVTRLGVLLAATGLMAACSDSDSSGSSVGTGGNSTTGGMINSGASAASGNEGNCEANTAGVNWDALMTENCPNLSDYNLFQNSTDPTANPNAGGVIFDLTTPLFTDYASKYRFVFVPEGETIKYNENEVLSFPIGTVIAKTFTMPVDTSARDGDEVVIETRLLIHRESGWVARPYYWNPGSGNTDAALSISSKTVSVSTTHEGTTRTFDYIVPSQASCLSCHAVQSAGLPKITLPIGPKARFLNRDFDYTSGSALIQTENETANQLTYWAEHGILSGLPNLTSVPVTPSYRDENEAGLTNMSKAEVQDAAEAYLDINCAHCHRAGLSISEIQLGDGSYVDESYRGAAGSTGLQMEYNRNFEDDQTKFGVCKTPVAGGHNSYPQDVVPTRADLSYLRFRVDTTDSRHKMPELGRVTIHDEGVSLISAWINQMDPANCTP
ncbi:hypothetical protein [Litoribrevibacter albus]|uniref:Cytochrome c domain-containing protein n=1 Tax=Litoribrevibacter albus TaxID=1473156 RepID=A0AA37SBQ0_9GAMM|nr:hypothetical protein [Litoribrevibacter albus]GLQ32274.1 hypothetical protein GCM10007876_27530 [Litoribrevibacter albus]